ncbi:hypothetical protein FO519_000441 [Halicephalobus sp. NKZ332]|nr:hypothetical protein FO519_000441 [Halicephalobus sp. NKZ332]
MLTDEAFQKLLYDLFCTWHDVQRHYDPPRTESEGEKMTKIKSMLCKLIDEISGRVRKVQQQVNEIHLNANLVQDLIEEWALLTWNVLCISSRLQNNYQSVLTSSEDKQIYSKLNASLVDLVNCTSRQLTEFNEHSLIPFIEMFKTYCNEYSVVLWRDVRAAQIKRMNDFHALSDDPVTRLVSFYSSMVYCLAVLGARLQGFSYEFTQNKIFGPSHDPIKPLSDVVFSALELLMADCVLCTEPSTDPILVTNNLFPINCGALARGVVFKQFDVQLVTEEVAEHIQSEMRRQKLLQQPSPIQNAPSAALKDIITIYPVYHSKNRYWAATYPHLLCTTRQKGRQSTHNSYQDLSPNAQLDIKTNGKRPIFYFHIRATMFSPSGKFADAHTLSLPLTIATRRNQDCQVQRMMSSYTATCFWLYGCNIQDGLLLSWVDMGMDWDKFKKLFKQHFKVNADVTRGLVDRDFDLLQYKLKCNDCRSDPGPLAKVVTFKNMLCPHLRYECGTTNVRFSVWRGMLELLQIFQDAKTNVRKLWEKNLLLGFMEFDQVARALANYDSALIMRLSFVTGGTICFTVKSNAHSLQHGATAPMHLEPLDLKKLQAKCLKDYLRDIAIAEKVKYVINANFEPVLISDIIDEYNASSGAKEEFETSRHISSNVTHSGDIDNMQHITFTAMRIAVVTCKVKPPSADSDEPKPEALSSPIPSQNGPPSNASGSTIHRFPASANGNDEFLRELMQLCSFYGKSKQDLLDAVDQTSGFPFQYSPPGSMMKSSDSMSNGMGSFSQPPSANPTPPPSAGYNSMVFPRSQFNNGSSNGNLNVEMSMDAMPYPSSGFGSGRQTPQAQPNNSNNGFFPNLNNSHFSELH